MNINLRRSRPKDRPFVIDIFNSYVENSFAAFTEQSVGPQYYTKLKQVIGDLPFYVAELEDGDIVGYGCLHPHHTYPAFDHVANITYFLKEGYTRMGIGKRLLEQLFEDGVEMGIEIVLACISSLNQPSLDFHRKNGFIECGKFAGICRKQGKTFDIIWMQRYLTEYHHQNSAS